jgi:DNA (cytosine-5)-methyltransferase 1
MRILNAYAGIGGNRKLWNKENTGEEHEIVAVELNPQIAKIYQDFFPNDKVIVGDAHQYLLEHFKEFEFIWSSPPCPTHSITRFMQDKKVYPDMGLYQEVIILQQWFRGGRWIVENVIPYYNYLIEPTTELHRHAIWSNFPIADRNYPKMETCKKLQEREFLQNELGFNIDKYEGIDKRKLLRNCVLPELGLHILNSARKENEDLFTVK